MNLPPYPPATGRLTTPRSPRVSLRSLTLPLAFLLPLALVPLLLSPSAAQATETCPNEALRTELNSGLLPDCRAYEMASPVYKEGYEVPFKQPIAADGDKAIVYSLANLAGGDGASENAATGSVYVDERGPAGWKLTSLNPPSSQFVGQMLQSGGWEPDTGETAWELHTLAQGEKVRELYVRSPGPDGTFARIGPMSVNLPENEPPSNAINIDEQHFDRQVAATSDYGHILLEGDVPEDYWPFDHTASQAGSIYEYSGTGNAHPILVGVEGEEKGNNHLVGECGIELGSSGAGSEYNALSANGETVFFTVAPDGRYNCTARAPENAELYARSHGALTSAGRAETVHVSASECTIACGSEGSGKNFEGASESGELVYFTSTQKLANDAVDGTAAGDAQKQEGCATLEPEEGGCNLYLYDFREPEGARLTTVAAGEVKGVSAIAPDGERIYFVSLTQIAAAGQNEFSEVPVAKQPNLYVYDAETGRTAFIATLGESEQGAWRREYRHPFQVAGVHGSFLLFASARRGVTPDDLSTKGQYFEYDAVTGELVRVTQGEGGFDENGNGVAFGAAESLQLGNEELGNGQDFHSAGNRLNISGDGKTIAFRTRGQLSPRAISAARGCSSIYEFHASGAIDEGTVHLISDGRDIEEIKSISCGPRFAGMDQSGENIFFETADPLISSDTDGAQRDTYDARVDGGFAAPATEEPCTGEACAGPPPPPPMIPGASASTALTGEHNFAPPPAPPVPAPRAKPLTRAQKLAKALRTCRKKPRKQRAACGAQARKRYGAKQASAKRRKK